MGSYARTCIACCNVIAYLINFPEEGHCSSSPPTAATALPSKAGRQRLRATASSLLRSKEARRGCGELHHAFTRAESLRPAWATSGTASLGCFLRHLDSADPQFLIDAQADATPRTWGDARPPDRCPRQADRRACRLLPACCHLTAALCLIYAVMGEASVPDP